MLWYYQAILAILVITVIVMVPGNTVITELTPLARTPWIAQKQVYGQRLEARGNHVADARSCLYRCLSLHHLGFGIP